MNLTMMISILLIIMFMNSSHPVMIMAMILMQTLMLCLNMWFMMNTSWFSYILFLIFLGGLMVLFVYTVSLASNEKFSMKIKGVMKIVMPMMMFMILYLLMLNQTEAQTYFSSIKSFYNMYSMSMISITVSTMLYLLLTLIVVVKMTSKFKGPLRNMLFKLSQK